PSRRHVHLPCPDLCPKFIAVVLVLRIRWSHPTMRLHPVWGLVLFFLFALAAGTLAYGADTPAGYERRTLEGFTVYVNQQVLKNTPDATGRRPLDVLDRELSDLRRILVPRIVGVLQEVPIWAEWDETDKQNAAVLARYYGGSAEGLLRLGG